MRFIRRRFVAGLAALLAAPRSGAEAPPLRFGVPPWQKDLSGDDIRAHYRPMLDELSAALKRRILLVGARDYGEIVELLADGRIELASISPAPYLLARRRNPGITMILTELSWNAELSAKRDYYLGYVLALKSREDIQRVEDLRGKRFGFVATESTSGFIVPKNMLARKGINWETYFSKAYFLGSHPRVTDALVAGSIDGAATWEFNLAQAIVKHGDVFKILATSERIPNLGIAVHPSVSMEQRRTIQSTLTRIAPEKLKGLSAVGYVMRPPESYDRIRRLLE
jgi:phosphonate transport system substrate-binding protein